jgi:hypothetical protein
MLKRLWQAMKTMKIQQRLSQKPIIMQNFKVKIIPP